MAEGGYENPAYDPETIDDHDGDGDDDDEQDHEETTPFWPGSACTLGPDGEEIPMQTMHHEKSGDEKPAMLERAKKFIKRKFPRVNFGKLGPIGFSKKSGNETTIVSFGSKGGETEIFEKDDSGLFKKFTDKFKTALGPEAKSLIAQEKEEIGETRQSLREAEKQLQEAEKLSGLIT